MLIYAIPATNSVGFLDAVFDHLEKGQIFAVVRPDAAAHPALVQAKPVTLLPSDTKRFSRSLALHNTDDPAQIVFSSGTEGYPKAIVLSRRNLDSTVTRLNAAMQTTSDIREYVGVPVTYSFGLGRVRSIAAVGGQSYIPDAFDPSELRRMLAQGDVNAFSVVPSLCRVILRAPAFFAPVADRVRWIEIGSQYMSGSEKAEMRSLFPKARIVQHYGLTEASRSTLLDITTAPDAALDSVGPVNGPIAIRIGDEGRICLRGDNVALGQIAPDGEIDPLTDDDGWLVTQDEGVEIDGYLHYRGRLDDQINLGGIKLSAEALERNVVARVPSFEGRIAVVAMPDAMRGQIPLVAIEANDKAALDTLRPAVAAALATYGVSAGDAFQLRAITALPRTGSAKIQRGVLRRQLQDEVARTTPVTLPAETEGKSVEGVFRHNFPDHAVGPQTRFDDLGGDSLTHLTVALDLEQVLGSLPDGWQSMAAADLAGAARARTFLSRIDMPTVIRALSISLVVSGHFDFIAYGGTGAFALFFIGGISFAMLTVTAIQRTGSVAAIFTLLARIVVLTWAVISVNWVLTGYGDPRAFTLLGNWFSPDLPGDVWFVDIYVQSLTLLALPLLSTRVRQALAAHPFAVAFGASVAAVVLMIVSEQIVDANSLYRRLPHLLLWMFLCGAAMQFAMALRDRILTLLVFWFAWYAFSGFSGIDLRYVVFAVSAIALFPSIELPRLLNTGIRHVANASLMIYLTHFQFRAVTDKVIGPNPMIATIAAIIGGTILWILYRPIDSRLRHIIDWITGSLDRDHKKPVVRP